MMTVDVEPKTSRTLADTVYRMLRRDIVAGQLAPGAKLKLEGLVARYQTGMAPLREALARLTGDRLVITQNQRGFWVAPLSLEALDDVTRVRSLIETEALNLSIRNGTPAWEAAVRQSFAELAELERTLPHTSQMLDQAVVDEWEVRNWSFHAALVAASGSPMLGRLRDMLYQQSERYRRISVDASRAWRNVHDEHVAIFEATMDRNALRACRMMDHHLARTATEVRKAMAGALEGAVSTD